MANIIVALVIILLVALSIRSTVKHFKGEGGCCGGGSSVPTKKKRLNSPVIAKKALSIEGMKCAGCSSRIQNSLNDIEGLVAKVNYKKGRAEVKMSREVSDAELKSAVEGSGAYKLLSVQSLAG